MYKYLFLIFAICGMVSCRPETFTPKPVGYFRIDTPQTHEYRLFDQPGYPYTFEYPVYARIEKDTAFFAEKADNPYWININFFTLNGIINLTYKRIPSKESFYKMVEDSYNFSNYHNRKADYIDQSYYRSPNGVYGILYVIGGNAASRYQFTATDSVKNFVRGALYFDVSPNADSLQPATDFIEQDIKHFLMTLKFR
jgi:gliding motility-associated lipoprotein GldD